MLGIQMEALGGMSCRAQPHGTWSRWHPLDDSPLPKRCCPSSSELASPSTTTARHRTPSRMAPDPAMLQRQSFLSRVSQRVSQELVEPPQQVLSRGICSLPLLSARPAAAAAAAAAAC